MPVRVPPPTDVLTLVFLAWAAGTVVFGAWSRTWKVIQPGHFKVVWLVSTGLMGAAGLGYRPAWIAAAACLATYVGIYGDVDLYAGALAAVAAVAVLVAGAPFFGLAVAAMLGAVTNAMLLGHWHLNQPKLGTGPIVRIVWGLWAGLAAFIGASVWLLTGASGDTRGLVVLGAASAIGFVAFAAVLTGVVHHLVRTRSIMSATGILYLEILLCFVAAFTSALAALA